MIFQILSKAIYHLGDVLDSVAVNKQNKTKQNKTKQNTKHHDQKKREKSVYLLMNLGHNIFNIAKT